MLEETNAIGCDVWKKDADEGEQGLCSVEISEENEFVFYLDCPAFKGSIFINLRLLTLLASMNELDIKKTELG